MARLKNLAGFRDTIKTTKNMNSMMVMKVGGGGHGGDVRGGGGYYDYNDDDDDNYSLMRSIMQLFNVYFMLLVVNH